MANTNLVIERAATFSTSHITPTDAQKLQEYIARGRTVTSVIGYQKDEYGWFVHVPSDRDDMLELIKAMRADGYSDAFIILIETAHHEKLEFVQLDRDADVIEGFVTFDW